MVELNSTDGNYRRQTKPKLWEGLLRFFFDLKVKETNKQTLCSRKQIAIKLQHGRIEVVMGG